MFSPSVSLPFTCVVESTIVYALNCSTTRCACALYLSASLFGPPVAQVALGVELAALVVEAVRHLVADDGAHGAVVHARRRRSDRRTAAAECRRGTRSRSSVGL